MVSLRSELAKLADPRRAAVSRSFFKTGKGEYGEGDVFIGVSVPQLRILAKKFSSFSPKEVLYYLNSKVHEERLVALFILVGHFDVASAERRVLIAKFYLRHASRVNNWDLVDSSADKILGVYLLDKPRDVLFKLAVSKNLWERRIAIIASFAFIREGEFGDTLKLSRVLLADEHDLMHKAVGWMLREVGKRDKSVLVKFLRREYKRMPRTMLRYAIEKFPASERKKFLEGKI